MKISRCFSRDLPNPAKLRKNQNFRVRVIGDRKIRESPSCVEREKSTIKLRKFIVRLGGDSARYEPITLRCSSLSRALMKFQRNNVREGTIPISEKEKNDDDVCLGCKSFFRVTLARRNPQFVRRKIDKPNNEEALKKFYFFTVLFTNA